MLLAVLQRRVGMAVQACDVYAATVGGASLRGPSSDLAAALAVASSITNVPVPEGTVAIGEVGLAGELRAVPDIGQRLAEAARLGFTRAVIPNHRNSPSATLPTIEGMRLVECTDLYGALNVLGIRTGGEGPEADPRSYTDLHLV